MPTAKQTKAARRNVTKAQEAATSKRSIAHMPKQTRTALGKQGAAVARRKRTGGDSPKTRAELYEIAKSNVICRAAPRWDATNSLVSSAKNSRQRLPRGCRRRIARRLQGSAQA